MQKKHLASDLEDQNFKTHDFSDISFAEKSFSHCLFESCNFIESSWQSAKFASCIFKNCNLSLINLKNCRLYDVVFEESKLVGIDFSQYDTSFIFSISAKKCLIQHCSFSHLPMKKTLFQQSKIHGSNFIDSCLVEADFTGADLKDTMFHTCDLSNSNFCHAVNYAIDPQVNKVKGAKFSFPEVVGLLKNFEITIS